MCAVFVPAFLDVWVSLGCVCGHVCGMSGACVRHVWGMSEACLGHVWNVLKHLCGMRGTCSGRFGLYWICVVMAFSLWCVLFIQGHFLSLVCVMFLFVVSEEHSGQLSMGEITKQYIYIYIHIYICIICIWQFLIGMIEWKYVMGSCPDFPRSVA